MAQRKVSCEVYTDRGIVGPKGDTGTPNSLSIGTVEGGETASAAITGDAPNQTLNLVLPKGDKGDDGQDGADGRDGTDGQDGADGVGISTISKTGTSGLVDTYTITMTDGNSSTFTVTNGKDGEDGQDGQNGQDGSDGVGISSISKTGTAGLVDTYTISLTNGNSTTFDVTNGKDGADGADGADGQNGQDGQDGYSPTATVTKSGSVATITITDKNGTTTATVSDGTGSVTDVQVDGVSVVSSGIASITSELPSQTGNNGKYLKTNGSTASWGTISYTYDPATETLTIN